MREIKFRVYHDKWGWAEPNDITVLGDNDGWVDYRYDESGDKASTYEMADIDIHLMQYTGLKDCQRNKQYPEGQEIYEGDIISYKYYKTKYTDVVKYAKEIAGFMPFCTPIDYDEVYLDKAMVRVIGNIWENAELVGGDV